MSLSPRHRVLTATEPKAAVDTSETVTPAPRPSMDVIIPAEYAADVDENLLQTREQIREEHLSLIAEEIQAGLPQITRVVEAFQKAGYRDLAHEIFADLTPRASRDTNGNLEHFTGWKIENVDLTDACIGQVSLLIREQILDGRFAVTADTDSREVRTFKNLARNKDK